MLGAALPGPGLGSLYGPGPRKRSPSLGITKEVLNYGSPRIYRFSFGDLLGFPILLIRISLGFLLDFYSILIWI